MEDVFVTRSNDRTSPEKIQKHIFTITTIKSLEVSRLSPNFPLADAYIRFYRYMKGKVQPGVNKREAGLVKHSKQINVRISSVKRSRQQKLLWKYIEWGA